jgi:hypothetical protein
MQGELNKKKEEVMVPLSTMMASINSKGGGGRRKIHGSFVDTRVCFSF